MISLTSQLSALRRLNSVDRDLRVLDKRLNTGIRVADTKDSTSAVSASRASSARSTSFFTVQSSLDLGIATVSTASSAITSVGSFLGNIRDLLEAAKDGSADLSAIQAQLTDQRMKLRSTVSNAAFKNVNLLANSTSTSGYLGAPKDAAGTAYAIAVDRNRTRLLDTLGQTGVLQKTFDLTPLGAQPAPPSTLGLSGTATSTAASTAGTGTITVDIGDPAGRFVSGDSVEIDVALNGVSKTVKLNTRSMATSAAAKAELQRALDAAFGASKLVGDVSAGYDFTITTAAGVPGNDFSFGGFRIVDGDDITTSTLGMTGGNFHYVNNSTINGQNRSAHRFNFNATGIDKTDRIKLVIDSQSAGAYYRADGQYVANGSISTFEIIVSLQNVNDRASLIAAINTALDNGSGAKDYFAADVTSGSTSDFYIYHKTYGSSIRIAAVTALNGDGATAGTPAYTTTTTPGSAAVAASATTGSDFAGPVTVDAGASISFDLSVDVVAAKRVTIQRSTVEAALGGVAGRTAGTGIIANASEFALVVQRALVEASVGGVTATASGNRIKLAKTATGAGQIAIGPVSSAAAPVATAASTTTLDSINVGGAGFASLSASQRGTLLNDYIANLDAMTKRVAQAASYLNFVGKQLEIQSKHTTKLQGIETNRVGGLINTNMTAEEARRSAMEARLALARKSIEIVNASRKNILNIF